MEDKTEGIRKMLVQEINAEPGTKEALEEEHGEGNVFDTEEATEKFEFLSFMAPFAVVERKEDRVKGTLTFQDQPRFYFGFRPE